MLMRPILTVTSVPLSFCLLLLVPPRDPLAKDPLLGLGGRFAFSALVELLAEQVPRPVNRRQAPRLRGDLIER